MRNYADYQTQIEQLRSAAQYDFVAIALVEPAENQYVLKWKYGAGNLNDRFKKVVLKSGKGIAGIVYKTGKPLLIKNVSGFEDPTGLFNYPIVTFEKLRSIGAVPLWHNGRVAGVLLAGFRDTHKMTDEELELLWRAADKGIGNLNGKDLMLS
ncbi:GAF domain-containing protein [Planomicrobium sp. YIM 101495]|uniref:GAF domain-containing protein n=1 Tax=Planomicrobium sp. YIM 101495 TaxID=2665160 RepID=UPI0012B9F44C|nr:GAF domain-containing protein [Planomicrobium sp. YIM 101495]MTD29496.1 GAF domain-containing protein [Planomicrobium sp. YIM 101495]